MGMDPLSISALEQGPCQAFPLEGAGRALEEEEISLTDTCMLQSAPAAWMASIGARANCRSAFPSCWLGGCARFLQHTGAHSFLGCLFWQLCSKFLDLVSLCKWFSYEWLFWHIRGWISSQLQMMDFQKIPWHGRIVTPLSSGKPQLCPLLLGLDLSSVACTFFRYSSSALDIMAALFLLLVLCSLEYSRVLTSQSFITPTLCCS